MTTVGKLLLQSEFHELFSRWGHVLKTLTKRNYGKAHALKVLHHLHRTPAVKGDFPNVVTGSQVLDELFDVSVMHHVALSGFQKSLFMPDVVRHVITTNTKLHGVFGDPEEWHDVILVILIIRREHQNESGNVGGAG